MINLKKIFLVILSISFCFLLYLGVLGPETYVYLGRHIPNKFRKTIHHLELIKDHEHIKFFYSDGLINIEDGIYLITDKNIVLHSNEWKDNTIIVPYEEIEVLQAVYSKNWAEDSWIFITDLKGDSCEFPLSNEKGRDKKAFEYMKKNIRQEALVTEE